MFKKALDVVETFFEKLDQWRDRVLFAFIKPYWPRFISPNHLTFIRIVIGIALFIMLFSYQIDGRGIVFLLFCVGALTDLFDGSVARGLNQKTRLGALIDPVADRILIIPIAVYSLLNEYRYLLLWLVTLEVINGLVSLYAQAYNTFLDVNIFGKIKMVLQSVVFAAILVFWPQSPNLFFIDMLWLSMILMIISIFLKISTVNNILHHES